MAGRRGRRLNRYKQDHQGLRDARCLASKAAGVALYTQTTKADSRCWSFHQKRSDSKSRLLFGRHQWFLQHVQRMQVDG